MGSLKAALGLSAVVFVAGLATPAVADECHSARGQLSSSFFVVGCTSPVGFCTAGTITQGGRLNGTDVFVATSISPTETAGVVFYTGVLTVTAKGGTITFATSGTMNFVTGHFTETDVVTAGTGRFAGATGELTISGALKPDNSGFLSTITGQTCRSGDGYDGGDAD